jgi:cephalosporin-C deacetylase
MITPPVSAHELESYQPQVYEPADFDAFWGQTLAQARAFPLNARFEPVDYGLRTVQVYDVSFAGYDGQTVKGWFLYPAYAETGQRLPCVVEYLGYGGGRSLPTDWLAFPSAGFAYLVMDTRGQGSGWSVGHTPDITAQNDPHHNGFMTLGILSPADYYYRRVYTDAVRAIEAARSHPLVDGGKIILTGGSQGGGITIAASGLMPDVALTMPDVPFLCHFHEATRTALEGPYLEIVGYLKIHRTQVERAFQTLGYFDGVNFARRAQAPALFSTGMMDLICPPKTVFAAYNAWAGPKQNTVYEFNGHEGGGNHHLLQKIHYAQQLMFA